jgi:uncharacterized protein DUF4270
MRMTEKNDLKRYQLIFLLPLIMIIVFLAACQKPSIDFGASFVNSNSNSNNTSVVQVDTATVQLSTVLVDSFPTAGTGSMLLGHYNDSKFGIINAGSFLQIGIPGASSINSQSVYDSLVLMMRINKTFYGDTTLSQRYYVSQLTSVIQFPSSTQKTFYNNSSFPYDPSPLGFTDVTILPARGLTSQNAVDSVKIDLPDTLGQHLFEMIQTVSDTIKNLNSFIAYFKGLAIFPDNASAHSGTMYGFKDTVTMRLFYHQPGFYTSYNHVDFTLNNKSNQFNRITSDRSASPLAVLNSAQANRPNPLIYAEVPSSQTDNAMYVQSATGIQGKIRFPYISNILSLPGYLGILRAQLILKPVIGTFNPELSLPPQLILSQTDVNNELGSPIISGSGIEYGNLYIDYNGAGITTYSYDITNYIKQQLTIGGNNTDGLMLSLPPPSNNTIFDRAVFGDATNKNYNITLNLYYISIPH